MMCASPDVEMHCLVQALKLPLIAPSLGGVESLVTVPAKTSHLAIGVEGRKVCIFCLLPHRHLL